MPIKQLNDTIINQIAAGEVIERPASVIKELVENAIDAEANKISIDIQCGGKNLTRVQDNGIGIEEKELILAISRHCTSKMEEDIHAIHALGFRGEALPSIGSVAKLRLISRPKNAENGAEILVEGGKITGPRPASCNQGTIVEVRDLFFATPARLKFMKTERSETTAIIEIIKRIAIAYPHIHFTLSEGRKKILDYPKTDNQKEANLLRIKQVLGDEFSENLVPIQTEKDNVRLNGYGSVPAFTRANSLYQFAYINKRPVRDKLILSAIQVGYLDFITRGRYPVCILFIDIDPHDVDVNVHPAKADVRFRDPNFIRGLIIKTIRQTFGQIGLRTSYELSNSMIQAFKTETNDIPSPTKEIIPEISNSFIKSQVSSNYNYTEKNFRRPVTTEKMRTALYAPLRQYEAEKNHQNSFPEIDHPSTVNTVKNDSNTLKEQKFPLGAARAQIHKNYIISQTEDSLIIVDQHAAHERLVYEALKESLYGKPLQAQMLLLPEIVSMPQEKLLALLAYKEDLKNLGLGLEAFGTDAILVRETPAILGEFDVKTLIKDLADEVMEHESVNNLKEIIDYVAATIACHGSIRSGRILKTEEMNTLLRQMEKVPQSATCNHGRPTYIELKLHDIEKLFKRK